MSTLLVIITALLLDTTSTKAYLQGHYRQSTMPIEGTSGAGFSVCARSIYDIDSVNRVFGEAAYSWAQSQGNIGIENADPYLLYPYLTYDTIGGGLRTETYWFRGGYRRAKQHLIWHLALQYRALQSYRNIDPRPKNKVADLSVEGSVGYIDERYAYSIMAQAGRYKQNNDIAFYSELGEAMIHHLVLPDQAYSRFSGAYKSAYYHGLTTGVQVMIQPQKQGFVAGAGYRFLTATEELSSTTSIPIARLQTHTTSAQFGYAAPLWRLYAQAEYTIRQGTQHLYGEAANNYYQLLASTPNYHEQQLQAALYGTYRLNLPIGYMCFDAQAAYRYKHADYPHTDAASLAPIAAYLLANQADAQIAIGYTFPLKDRYCWFVRPIADYTAYSTHTHSWQIVLQTGVCF